MKHIFQIAGVILWTEKECLTYFSSKEYSQQLTNGNRESNKTTTTISNSKWNEHVLERDAQTNKKVSNGDELSAWHMNYKAQVIIITDVDRLTTQWVNEILDESAQKKLPIHSVLSKKKMKKKHTHASHTRAHINNFTLICLHFFRTALPLCWTKMRINGNIIIALLLVTRRHRFRRTVLFFFANSQLKIFFKQTQGKSRNSSITKVVIELTIILKNSPGKMFLSIV